MALISVSPFDVLIWNESRITNTTSFRVKARDSLSSSTKSKLIDGCLRPINLEKLEQLVFTTCVVVVVSSPFGNSLS